VRARGQHWGLVPSWCKAENGGRPKARAINARDDSVRDGRSIFAAAARRRRCVVLADGYECRGFDDSWTQTLTASLSSRARSASTSGARTAGHGCRTLFGCRSLGGPS
jgi:putative SOS response-associated peptidase YedK